MCPRSNYYDYLISVKGNIEKKSKFPLNISELAKLEGVSKSKLEHDFKAAFGITMQDYQSEIRVNIAKHLLQDSSRSIKHIANQIGYKTAPSFTHAFKKITTQRPSEYRRGKPL